MILRRHLGIRSLRRSKNVSPGLRARYGRWRRSGGLATVAVLLAYLRIIRWRRLPQRVTRMPSQRIETLARSLP